MKLFMKSSLISLTLLASPFASAVDSNYFTILPNAEIFNHSDVCRIAPVHVSSSNGYSKIHNLRIEPRQRASYTTNPGVSGSVTYSPLNYSYSCDATALPGTDRIVKGQTFYAGQSIKSANNKFMLVMQHDGNLVLYKLDVHGNPSSVKWATYTHRNPGARFVFQHDSNLVVYAADNRVLWASYTFEGDRLVVQNDGNLVQYDMYLQPIWNTSTQEH